MIKLALSIMLALSMSMAQAAIDVYEFANEKDRARYQRFIEELRCPKCKNQNLAGSNSEISIDLREKLYQLINEGSSDEEIIDYMVTRYTDFVLYRPPVQENTLALWYAPFVMLGVGLGVLGAVVWRRSRSVNAEKGEELSDEEEEHLRNLLAKGKGR